MQFSTTGHYNPIISNVGSFLANLPEILGALSTARTHYVIVAEFMDVRYCQFWMDDTGIVIGEVISNLNIGDLVALNADEETELLALGFSPPEEFLNPNYTFEANSQSEMIRLVRMIESAVLNVLKETPTNPVEIRSWEMGVSKDMDRDLIRSVSRNYYEYKNCD